MQVSVIKAKDKVMLMAAFPSFLYRKMAVSLSWSELPKAEFSDREALSMVIVVVVELK